MAAMALAIAVKTGFGPVNMSNEDLANQLIDALKEFKIHRPFPPNTIVKSPP
jgi:hypothetical protein